jgi:cyclopropane fatty-acyl-phospholipid synthase-like methyltransferase
MPKSAADWDRAGFGPGQRLLDVGCGPGFASLDLVERVGGYGQVLASTVPRPTSSTCGSSAGSGSCCK